MNQNANSDSKLENVYLKFFKYAIVGLMTLALLAVAALLPLAAFNYLQTPVAPAPAKEPPQRSITIDDLKKYLVDEEKRRLEQEKGGNSPKRQPAAAAPVTQRYLEDAIALYRCAEEFRKLADQDIDNSSEATIAQRNETQRANIEGLSADRFRGPSWVKAMVAFTCSVLKNEEVAKLKKEKAIGSVVAPTINFHAQVWSMIERDKAEFKQREAQRVAAETASEALRVAVSKSKALFMLGSAGALLGFFLLLALYLIFAKIEDNLRLIHKSIDRHQIQGAG